MYIKSTIAEVQFFQDLSFLKDVVEYEEAGYLPASEGYRLPVFIILVHVCVDQVMDKLNKCWLYIIRGPLSS